MSLFKGDKLIKLDQEGKPLTPDRELYIEWEVVETGGTYMEGNETHQQVVLKKLK